ncbi:MAG: hypothetical protein GY822_19505 [Deltaproteobacteria bacterium]|nr:hypothetical protein [Deltaproteobacteria bacterium]
MNISRTLSGRAALGLALLVSSTFGASSASAYSTGQVDLSGKVPTQSCLNCHGSNSYDGINIEVTGGSTCFDLAGDEIMYAAPGDTLAVNIVVDKPAETLLACPTDDCCGVTAPAVDAACMTRPLVNCPVDNFGSCCFPSIDDCSVSQVGFNLEATSGVFSSNDDNVRLALVLGETLETQTTHVTPLEFDEATSVSWSMDFTVASIDDIAAAKTEYDALKADNDGMQDLSENTVAFFLGATVANGNFVDDSDDLNANLGLVLPISGEDIPPFCAVCENGALPGTDGLCEGGCSSCKTDTSRSWPAGLAGLMVFGVFALRRRRRS